jgi:hypothetical protein
MFKKMNVLETSSFVIFTFLSRNCRNSCHAREIASVLPLSTGAASGYPRVMELRKRESDYIRLSSGLESDIIIFYGPGAGGSTRLIPARAGIYPSRTVCPVLLCTIHNP